VSPKAGRRLITGHQVGLGDRCTVDTRQDLLIESCIHVAQITRQNLSTSCPREPSFKVEQIRPGRQAEKLEQTHQVACREDPANAMIAQRDRETHKLAVTKDHPSTVVSDRTFVLFIRSAE
jgi:hypothetical protein